MQELTIDAENNGVMGHKTILFGQLDFGNAKSFERVRDMAIQRAEVYYRGDILIDLEAIFQADQLSLLIQKHSFAHEFDKSWRNTVKLIQHASQFAVSGRIYGWLVEEGSVSASVVIEPDNDHGSVRHYQRAVGLLESEGMQKQEEALELLNHAIQAHEGHAQALHARAELWCELGEKDRALEDYTCSIRWAPILPEGYLGRSRMYIEAGQYEDAIMDLTSAVKFGIPHQSYYWEARQMKAECFMRLGDFRNAEPEWRLLSRRKFSPKDHQAGIPLQIATRYGRTLLENGKADEAIRMIESMVLENDHSQSTVPLADLLLIRGLAMKKAGKKGFLSVLREAARAGSEQAADLLLTTA